MEVHIVKEIWRDPNICFMDRLSFPKQEYRMKATEKDYHGGALADCRDPLSSGHATSDCTSRSRPSAMGPLSSQDTGRSSVDEGRDLKDS